MSEDHNSEAELKSRVETEASKPSLSALAETVRTRLGCMVFRQYLRRGQWIVPLVGMVLIAALRLLGHWNSGEIWVALLILLVWACVGGVWVLWHRPRRLQALMVWDERSASQDRFASAWSFEQQDQELSEGQRRHCLVVNQEVAEAQQRVNEKLPLPSLQGAFWMTVLLLAFAVLPVLRPGIAAGDARLSDQMLNEAQNQAKQLADKAALFKSMEGLSEEEKAAAKKLAQMVKEASEDLSQSKGKSAREVLESLEKRARAAEALAKKLASDNGAWASQAMLKEMSQHADLADLALALKDKNAPLSSTEADRLEAMLDDEQIKEEAQQRMNTALSRTMAAADDEDKRKPVGEHVGNASIKMESKQPKTAARDFGRLADHFRKMARREAMQKKMQELANQMREAGSKISGSKLQQMKKLASQKAGTKMPKGMKPVQMGKTGKAGASMANNPINQQNTSPSQASSQSQLPVPGIQNQPMGAGQKKQGGASPVPGSKNAQMGKGSGKGKAMAMGQGKGKKAGAPGLKAPVPGQGQGQGMKAPGAGLGAGQGNGAGSAMASAPGGQNVGNGTTGLGANKTATQKAVRDSKVAAQVNANGESSMRAVQGKTHQETAQRERQQSAVDFIKVEEQALDERALPLSRRDHVLKYFTALRKKFAEQK